MKPKTCRVCKSKFTPHLSMQLVCGLECAKSLAISIRSKIYKREQMEVRRAVKAHLEKLKTRAKWQKEAQAAFNSFIRARDAGKSCVSCRSPLPVEAVGGGYDCGHYRSTGSAPHLRFVEDNAHGQCKKCNRYLSGNVADYRARLLHRIGPARLDALEADQDPRKYTIDDLKQIKATYQAKAKQLKEAQL